MAHTSWKHIRSGRIHVDEIVPEDIDDAVLINHAGLTFSLFSQEHSYGHVWTGSDLTSWNGFGCLFDYLFQPKPELFLPIAPAFMAVTKRREPEVDSRKVLKIGIHFRAGDYLRGAAEKSTIEDYQNIFDCAKQIESFALQKHSDIYFRAQWYFISDDPHAREYVMETFGRKRFGAVKVITSLNLTLVHTKFLWGKPSDHSKNDSFLEGVGIAAAEWYTFSFMDYYIIRIGGFGLSSAFRRGYNKMCSKYRQILPARPVVRKVIICLLTK
jgi:hypothetical protein